MTMASSKTAISLESPLLDRIDELARELEVSRSRLLALAAEDFLRKHENARMLRQIDLACADGPTEEERKVAQAMRSRHRQRIQRER
jgi:metal-responsive CopG/Arc/MetJ family transcriptional regulator